MSVRFLIYGGRGGFLDEHYAARANLIGTGKITKASELRESLKNELPTDSQFEQAFSTARVSKAYLARYYLLPLIKLSKTIQRQNLSPMKTMTPRTLNTSFQSNRLLRGKLMKMTRQAHSR
jgi:hypothetical protein